MTKRRKKSRIQIFGDDYYKAKGIRPEDLAVRRFDRIMFVLKCG